MAVWNFPEGEINKVIHEPARMKIMMYLYIVESADFIYLLRNTGLTKGNLSAHLSRLEQEEYLTIEKCFIDRVPKTLVALTVKGREEFTAYTKSMKSLFNSFPD